MTIIDYRGDPDSDIICSYKNFLSEICRNNQINIVLTLQGLSRESQYDADLGIVSTGNKGEKVVKDLARSMEGYGLANIAINGLIPEQGSVAHFVSMELGLTAIQIRVNRKYRVLNQNSTIE
ncbi:MAG: hypothetical protein ACYDG6_02665 [Thermincolia bacterium]